VIDVGDDGDIADTGVAAFHGRGNCRRGCYSSSLARGAIADAKRAARSVSSSSFFLAAAILFARRGRRSAQIRLFGTPTTIGIEIHACIANGRSSRTASRSTVQSPSGASSGRKVNDA
jgi:predicted RNase H-like nuclease